MRIAAIIVALAVLTCTGCLGSGAAGTPARGQAPVASAAFSGSARECPVAQGYVPRLAAAHGRPGMVVTLSGRLPLRGEDGRLKPAGFPTRISVWWNLRPARWTSVTGSNTPDPGAQRLASVPVPSPTPCRYRIAVRVPDAPAGTHPLLVIMHGGGGGAPLAPDHFRVEEG